MTLGFHERFETGGMDTWNSNDKFERGEKAHNADFVQWTCSKCKSEEETNGNILRRYCMYCNRWMEWQPTLYAEEMKC